uniref:U-box domain-containing protein n=1 Tax=Ananas comosus var. bracteatus TaxID=296719 RepID=A0A6V7NHK3_ANACO|nr:unnamed protein product [Ananas comosus var. bracteatus]
MKEKEKRPNTVKDDLPLKVPSAHLNPPTPATHTPSSSLLCVRPHNKTPPHHGTTRCGAASPAPAITGAVGGEVTAPVPVPHLPGGDAVAGEPVHRGHLRPILHPAVARLRPPHVPATRLPLPSTHLVPNLALRRLILSAAAEDDDGGGRSDPSAAEIASRIAAAGEGGDSEAAVRVLALMLGSDRVGKGDKESAIAALVADLDRSVSALLAVVRNGRGIGSRIDAVRVLESILASPARVCGEESRAAIAEREELFPELVRMMGEGGAAAEAAIGCMAAAAAAGKRRARARMVGAGAVAALARAIAAAEVSAAAAEQGMALVGVAAGCADGRVAIAGDAAAVVGALMGRITRVEAVGREARWRRCGPCAAAAAEGGIRGRGRQCWRCRGAGEVTGSDAAGVLARGGADGRRSPPNLHGGCGKERRPRRIR